MRNCLCAHVDGIKMRERNGLSDFRARSSITYSDLFLWKISLDLSRDDRVVRQLENTVQP